MKLKGRKLFSAGLLLILLTSLLLTACGAEQDSAMYEGQKAANYDYALSDTANVTSAPALDGKEIGFGSNENKPVLEERQQMIIYNGSFSIKVKDLIEASNLIEQKIKQAQGYLVNSNKSENEQRYYAHYEYRVPVSGFHSLVDEINNMNLGTITNQNVSGNDITKQYYDLDARLKAKKVYEERLLDFLTKAEKTEDLLRISNDLNRVQEEIESMQGELDYYKHHADFSTITVDLQQYKDQVAPNASTWEKSLDGFNHSIELIVNSLKNLFIWMISISPILLIGLFVIFILWRVMKAKRVRRKHGMLTDHEENDNDKE